MTADGASRREQALPAGNEVVPRLLQVSFTLSAGEMVPLVGPSGCGKSTTLNLIAGVDRPDEGEVIVCAPDLARAARPEPRARRRHTGIVPVRSTSCPTSPSGKRGSLPFALDGRKDPARVRDLLRRSDWRTGAATFLPELSAASSSEPRVRGRSCTVRRSCWPTEPTGSLDSAFRTACSSSWTTAPRGGSGAAARHP